MNIYVTRPQLTLDKIDEYGFGQSKYKNSSNR